MDTRSTKQRLDGLEKTTKELTKATNEINIQLQRQVERLSAMQVKQETFMAEVRKIIAGKPTTSPKFHHFESAPGHESHTGPPSGTPSMQMPTFDGTKAIAWLAHAEQFFRVSNTQPEARLPLAMAALAGPALPWIQLLERRLPALSWERFTQELIDRFGDNATPYIARQAISWPAIAHVPEDKTEVRRILTEEDHSKFKTGDEQVLEGFEKKEVAPFEFGSEPPHLLAALPPKSSLHYDIELVNDGFTAREYAKASMKDAKASAFIAHAGAIIFRTDNCQRNCLT